VFAPAVGWSFIGAGLYVSGNLPEHRIGVLMILLGPTWPPGVAKEENSVLRQAAR
jgi:hypothetical protein